MAGGFQKGAFTPAFQQVAVVAAFQCLAFQPLAFQNDCENPQPVAAINTTYGGRPDYAEYYREIEAARIAAEDAEIMQLTAMVVTYLITEDLL